MRIRGKTLIPGTFPISWMESDRLYYGTGVDGSAKYTLYLKCGTFFISALLWKNNDGTLRMNEEEDAEHFCFGVSLDAVKGLTVENGYLAMAGLSNNGCSELIAGDCGEHDYVQHFFSSDEPGRYLQRAEPLLKILASAQKEQHSYLFSIVTLNGKDIDAAQHVVGGYVQGVDEMSKIPAFYDLLDEVPDLESVDVVSHFFTIGDGESVDLPDSLADEIEKYGADDFIALPCVDQLERIDFTVDTEDFR